MTIQSVPSSSRVCDAERKKYNHSFNSTQTQNHAAYITRGKETSPFLLLRPLQVTNSVSILTVRPSVLRVSEETNAGSENLLSVLIVFNARHVPMKVGLASLELRTLAVRFPLPPKSSKFWTI